MTLLGRDKPRTGGVIVNQLDKHPPKRPMNAALQWALVAGLAVLSIPFIGHAVRSWEKDQVQAQDEVAQTQDQRDHPEWFPLEVRIEWATTMEGQNYDRVMTTRPEPPDLRLSTTAWCKNGAHMVDRCKDVQDGKPYVIGQRDSGDCSGPHGRFAHTYTLVYGNRKESGAIADPFCVGDDQPHLDYWTHYSLKFQGWGRYELRVDWQSGQVNSCGTWNHWTCKTWIYQNEAAVYDFDLKKGGP